MVLRYGLRLMIDENDPWIDILAAIQQRIAILQIIQRADEWGQRQGDNLFKKSLFGSKTIRLLKINTTMTFIQKTTNPVFKIS